MAVDTTLTCLTADSGAGGAIHRIRCILPIMMRSGACPHDDHRLFEMLVLEGFQAGLSWECVLNKRDGFRQAFDGLDASVMARYPDEKLEALRQDSRIIRNKLKIRRPGRMPASFWPSRRSGAVLMPICGTGRMERSYTNGIVPVSSVGSDFGRPQETGYDLCRYDHHLCLSAGYGRHL